MKNSVVKKQDQLIQTIEDQELDSLGILADVFVSQFKRYQEMAMQTTEFPKGTLNGAIEKPK